MKLIDSHCHLNYAGLAERQDEVLANARERGIGGFLNISTRQKEWGDVVGVAELRLARDRDQKARMSGLVIRKRSAPRSSANSIVLVSYATF